MKPRGVVSALALAALAVPWEGRSGKMRPKSLARPKTRRGSKSWTGSHDQERERRRRQIERGVIRKTGVVPSCVEKEDRADG